MSELLSESRHAGKRRSSFLQTVTDAATDRDKTIRAADMASTQSGQSSFSGQEGRKHNGETDHEKAFRLHRARRDLFRQRRHGRECLEPERLVHRPAGNVERSRARKLLWRHLQSHHHAHRPLWRVRHAFGQHNVRERLVHT